MTTLQQLILQFPNVTFVETGSCHYPRCEDAVYLGVPPQGHTEIGRFISMTNRHGGSDSVRASDTARLLALAAWHNNR